MTQEPPDIVYLLVWHMSMVLEVEGSLKHLLLEVLYATKCYCFRTLDQCYVRRNSEKTGEGAGLCL